MPKTSHPDFTPFADESATFAIGELTIENRVDRVSLYGSLDVTLDKEGEANLRRLEALVAGMRQAFNRTPDLPERVQLAPLGEMANPAPAEKL